MEIRDLLLHSKNGIPSIDGSRGEGGGQILRTALSLSMITGRPFEMVHIRASRKKPGLQAQHLVCVNAAQEICRAEVEGAQLGSKSIRFNPGRVRHGTYHFRIETAGSVALLLHSIYLPLCFQEGSSEIRITGGTHVAWAPTFDFLELCWAPFMGELGLPISLKLVRSGFYPHGGGEILVRIRGGSVEALRRGKRGDLKEIRIRSWQTNLREEVAQRQASGAKKILAAHRLEAEVEMGSLPSRSRSTALAVAAMFESSRCCFTGLGEPGKRAEIIGEETARRLLDFLDSEAVLEEHMADQILLPLCMAREDSEFTVSTITEHFLTNAGVIRIFRNVQFQLPEEGRSEGLVVVRPP